MKKEQKVPYIEEIRSESKNFNKIIRKLKTERFILRRRIRKVVRKALDISAVAAKLSIERKARAVRRISEILIWSDEVKSIKKFSENSTKDLKTFLKCVEDVYIKRKSRDYKRCCKYLDSFSNNVKKALRKLVELEIESSISFNYLTTLASSLISDLTILTLEEVSRRGVFLPVKAEEDKGLFMVELKDVAKSEKLEIKGAIEEMEKFNEKVREFLSNVTLRRDAPRIESAANEIYEKISKEIDNRINGIKEKIENNHMESAMEDLLKLLELLRKFAEEIVSNIKKKAVMRRYFLKFLENLVYSRENISKAIKKSHKGAVSAKLLRKIRGIIDTLRKGAGLYIQRKLYGRIKGTIADIGLVDSLNRLDEIVRSCEHAIKELYEAKNIEEAQSAIKKILIISRSTIREIFERNVLKGFEFLLEEEKNRVLEAFAGSFK